MVEVCDTSCLLLLYVSRVGKRVQIHNDHSVLLTPNRIGKGQRGSTDSVGKVTTVTMWVPKKMPPPILSPINQKGRRYHLYCSLLNLHRKPSRPLFTSRTLDTSTWILKWFRPPSAVVSYTRCFLSYWHRTGPPLPLRPTFPRTSKGLPSLNSTHTSLIILTHSRRKGFRLDTLD